MLTLSDNEKVLIVVHKHWFVMVGPIITFAVLLFAPIIVLLVLPLITKDFNQVLVAIFTNFSLSLYVMILIIFMFLIWMDFYLDMWIITSKRIIDIEQRGLFSREISEIPLVHIQDITMDVNGVIRTFLKFGTIRLQTAGEREFAIRDIPHLYKIKDLILKYSQIERSSK
ncbi:MAG: PH domain-containing protein [Candidatus Sungbacteria bacterium]|nr:PH domain-containing protein [Candidatus Sungbacteria bacterium]